MTRKGSVLAKYEAVLFDLYGTLVDSSLHEFKACVENISQLLGVGPKAFAEGFTQRFIEFELGTLDISQLVRAAAAGSGIRPTSQQLEIAGSLWADTVLASLRPRPDYIAALRAIKERGVRTGLITNCAPPTGEVWVQTEFKHCFDVTLFSYEVGLRKPDAAIYSLATDRLKVPPEACLFVGDGSSQELLGASRAGMTALQLWIPYEDSGLVEFLAREDWPHRIAHPSNVLDLLS